MGIIMVIIAIVGAFVMVVYLRRYTNIERMAMIEKGVDPQFFESKKRPVNTSWSLRFALLLIGGGVGLLLGNVLDQAYYVEEEVAYFSMLFICGGLGLIASYIIEERKLKAEEKNKSGL